jgi:hypothetical protein
MSRNTLTIVAIAAALSIYGAVAVAGQGPESIDIYGGRSGNVPFPHAQHQDRIKDCNICHSVFPQKTGAIQQMKAEGTLKPKKVMNLQCIKCHKQEKRAGKPHGPVTCTTCHMK